MIAVETARYTGDVEEAEKKETCPKCAGPASAAEKFCAACGYQLQVGAEEARDLGRRIGLKHAKKTFKENVTSGRRTILVLAILIALFSGLLFVLQASTESEIEKLLRDVRSKKENPMYDQQKLLEAEVQLNKLPGILMLVAVLLGVIAATYFGLWVWAKHRPLAATLTALILFLTWLLFNFMANPLAFVNPIAWIIPGIIIVSLVRAVISAQKHQKLQQQGI